ncbi:hypothetical protein [Timonella sp. A28]|uniref:hypothetical protein n=1 Tax=Timonella sp. A28 TaxID=3442640 RepID=UPI003EBC64A4
MAAHTPWRHDPESGNASLEFIGFVLILVIPALYIISALAHVQSASFAAQSAAHEAARLQALSRSVTLPHDAQTRMLSLAFEDQGLTSTSGNPHVQVQCDDACKTGGGQVHVHVSYEVSLPLLGWFPPARVTVSGNGASYIGEYVQRETT